MPANTDNKRNLKTTEVNFLISTSEYSESTEVGFVVIPLYCDFTICKIAVTFYLQNLTNSTANPNAVSGKI